MLSMLVIHEKLIQKCDVLRKLYVCLVTYFIGLFDYEFSCMLYEW